MKKILFLSMPVVSVEIPPLGPALMQAIAKECGVDSTFIDLNLDLYTQQKTNLALQEVWIWTSGELTYSAARAYIKLFQQWSDKINEYQPDWIGISVFSFYSNVHTTLFTKWLKKHNCQAKIIVGGAGVSSRLNQSDECFGAKIHSLGLVDYYVVGEGENTLRAILQNQLPYPGVNNQNFATLQNFDCVPIPIFDSFELGRYEYPLGKVSISVEGSRGCVRNCSFCDIKKVWKKYKFKNGSRLAEEFLELANKYQINNFWFNDSLINGSLKSYKQFTSILAEHNSNKSVNDQITWSGQFIVRSADQIKEEDIKLSKLAGCHTLAIGIESGSYKVRKHMGKPFTNEDIAHTFALLRKYDIKIFLLMIVGYPTETKTDFNETIEFFKTYRKLAIEGTISGVNLGVTQAILPGTPLYDMYDELGIEVPHSESNAHIAWFNSNSTLQLRIDRRVKLQKLAQEWGYKFFDSENQLKVFKNLLDPVATHIMEIPAAIHG